MSQNISNGSPEDTAPDVKNVLDTVKSPSRAGEYPQQYQQQQPVYAPQQVDGVPRPQLFRVDSRASLGIRPGLPNPLLRPQTPRPPPPGGTPFPPRPLIQQQRPGLPPGQNIYPPRPVPPLNGAPRPSINPGYRPQNFQRPPTPIVRPQGIFQQRSVPPPRPIFTTNLPPRSQTLDSSDINPPYSDGDETTAHLANDKNENERPSLANMKSKSYSVAENAEPNPTSIEDRRRSISSIGSIEEEKRSYPAEPDPYPRPESRSESLKKIYEDDTNIIAEPVNSSKENLSEKIHEPSPLPTSKTPSLTSPQQSIITSPSSQLNVNKSPSPQPTPSPPTSKSQSPQPEQIPTSAQRARSPLPVQPQQQQNERVDRPPSGKDKRTVETDKSGRKTPETKINASKLRLFKTEGDNDSGVDESTQGNDHLSNGDNSSPKKSTKNSTPRSATTPTKNKSFTRGAKSPHPKSPDTPTTPGSADKKKVPMNKVQVGSAPSPNLKVVKSKIGSLENAAHKPGGGNIRIENRKIDFSTTSSRIAAKNETYAPGGGEKKIQQQKLNWNVKPKVGSLENASHKPKGGDKKIENMKLDFKDKAKPKIGSKDNIKHVPGGGDVKIESKKLEIKVQSKIGSLDNIKHKPGGGDKKIYDDKEYLRQMSAQSNASLDGSQKKKPRPQSLELSSPQVNLVSPTQQRVRILDEVQICQIQTPESRPSSRTSRPGSARNRRSTTPRPPWRY
ncbi:hypothetical protein FQR65_LT09664 [Abscondita terminalis]|nr:hypothetical protein FQR65_LT09664 [Abscondita terminalis]